MPPARSERRYVPIPFWRRARRIFLLAAVACLVPAGISYVGAMSEKHNVGLGVSSVEWLRQHGGGALVTQIENWYYTLNAPEKGGPPLLSLPQVGVAGVRGSGRSASELAYRPPRVAPIIHPALPGEGVWKAAAKDAGTRPPILVTTFRSDPEYPQFVAGAAWIDSSLTHLSYIPGLAEPPSPLPHRGPSEVPGALRNRVVATFNGGFPLETSGGGLIYRSKVKETMVDGAATVIEYRNGSVDIVRWHNGAKVPPNAWFAKQNLPPIIYEGRLNPNLSNGPEWGETVDNAVRVWRSGLGIDRRSNLIYAAADNQTVESLAKILQRAGAVRALELDINEDWTSFISYSRPGAAGPGNLLPEMFRPADRYLTPDERDFFAVYLRAGEKW